MFNIDLFQTNLLLQHSYYSYTYIKFQIFIHHHFYSYVNNCMISFKLFIRYIFGVILLVFRSKICVK